MEHITVIQEPKNLEKLELDMDKKLKEKDIEIKKLKEEMQEIKLKLLEHYVEKHEEQINGK